MKSFNSRQQIQNPRKIYRKVYVSDMCFWSVVIEISHGAFDGASMGHSWGKMTHRKTWHFYFLISHIQFSKVSHIDNRSWMPVICTIKCMFQMSKYVCWLWSYSVFFHGAFMGHSWVILPHGNECFSLLNRSHSVFKSFTRRKEICKSHRY